MLTREKYEIEESNRLANYALLSRNSQGRVYSEPEHPLRTVFQRDRDRIIHSKAFRRLEYKTQVYITYEGEHYRTRLTHTLEVAQISRTIARLLRLNEDLSEAIALSHDLGHTPFGHAGEYVLNELLYAHGGFEHNQQGLRVVDFLEEKYYHHPGLNLTYEVREGILKHTVFNDENNRYAIGLRNQPTLECQIVDISDEIAYNTHDLDDALEQGLIQPDQLNTLELWQNNYHKIIEQNSDISAQYARYETIKEIINQLVHDLVSETENNIKVNRFYSSENIREYNKKTAQFSPKMAEQNRNLKSFLLKNVYCHPLLEERNKIAYQILTKLFQSYLNQPALLPNKIQQKFKQQDIYVILRDYIASMTDRFALAEYHRIDGSTKFEYHNINML